MEKGDHAMRELWVEERQEAGEDGRVCRNRYCILVDELPLGGGRYCESYGVKVTGEDGEEASVPNLTVSVERIDGLLELLRRNQVSPVHLRDVVEDWL